MAFTDKQTPINAVTGTTTSAPLEVSLREKLSFVFTCANHSTGNGVLSIDGSIDGINWVTGLAFQDATSTAPTTYIVSKTLSANSTVGGFLPIVPFALIRFVCTVTTDGTYTVTSQSYGN
jgi:hypothetical protein